MPAFGQGANMSGGSTGIIQNSPDKVIGGYIFRDNGSGRYYSTGIKSGGGSGSSGGGGSSSGSGTNSKFVSNTGGGSSSVGNWQESVDPWSKYRGAAGDKLAGMMSSGNDPTQLYTDKLAQMSTGNFRPDDPSYKFRMQQGNQAVERSLASRGLLGSGNAATELMQYSQNLASTEYGAQFDRMLSGLAGTTQSYDTQLSRLSKMAGVDANPAAAGQLALQDQANTDSVNLQQQRIDMGINDQNNAQRQQQYTNNTLQDQYNDQQQQNSDSEAGIRDALQQQQDSQQAQWASSEASVGQMGSNFSGTTSDGRKYNAGRLIGFA